MKSHQTWVSCLTIWLLLLGAGCDSSGREAQDQKEVVEVFEQYKEAVIDGDGPVAADLVTPKTYELYKNFLDLALDADEAETRSLPFIDKMSVVMIRHRLEPIRVRQMTGKDLFEHGISDGWTSQKSTVDLVADNVTIAGDQAWLDIKQLSTGMVAKKQFNLKKVGNDWKIDFVELLRKIGPALEHQLSTQTSISQDEMVKLIASVEQVKPATEAVWQPLGR